MTFNSPDDDWLKSDLDSLLWGYPHLIDIVLTEYADVRRRSIERRQTRQIVREAAPVESEKGALSPPPLESSAVVWAHADAEDVNPEYMTQGPDWYALFNPGSERSLDVSLVHTLTHRGCVSFTSSTV